MARKLRVEFEGAVYHVMNRGDQRERIFADDEDRRLFLATLGEACAKTEWQVHAFCLMSNHFHLVVETPRANLSAGMRWFLGTYTGRYNRRHRLFGHLFSGRFKALNVDAASPGYLKTVCDYVHLNPVRAKLIAAGRGRFEQGMEMRAGQERAKESGDWKKLRRGWCWGVGGQRHFGKNCWIGSGRGERGRTRAPKSGNRKSKRRNGSSAECCARRDGRRENWKSGPKGTRRRRESRKG